MAYKQAGKLLRVQSNAPGIKGSRSTVVRFMEKVIINPGSRACWIWNAHVEASGYGYFRYERGKYAHRAAYELLVAPIPEDMTIDHLCGNKLCVKPDHLEPVSAVVNIKRASGRWPQCDELHPETPTMFRTKPSGRAYCNECHRLRELKRRQRRRAERSESSS